jgi:hypothetical protein
MAISPFLTGLWSASSRPNAAKLPGRSPGPIVAAPAAIIPFRKNNRRLLEFLRTLPDFFIAFSFFHEIEFDYRLF